MDYVTYLKKKKNLMEYLKLYNDDELIMFLIRLSELDPVSLTLIFKLNSGVKFKNLLGLRILENLLSHYLYPEKF